MAKIGGMELLVILIVALFAIGPERLPKVARTLGRSLRAFKKSMGEATSELREVSDGFKEVTDELAGALEKLCLDPALRKTLGLNGRQRVEKHYQLQRMLEDYHRLYEEVSCDGGNRV